MLGKEKKEGVSDEGGRALNWYGMAKAAGKMGWTQDEFLFSTPSFFFAAFEGHIEQEEQRTAITLHGSRVVAYYAIAPHLKKGKRINLREIIELS